MNNQLTKIPKLKSGNDEAVAAKLNEMIDDASAGLRRIVAVGFFLERIASELKHGQFKPWVEAHCKEKSRSSIFGWRQLARGIMETLKISKVQLLDFSTPVHEMLALSEGKVPKEQKELREKIDALLEGKTARSLFFEFKQAEEDEDGIKKKHGRLKGAGGASPAQRAAAKAAEEAAAVTAAELWAEEAGEYITEHADDAHWGAQLEDKTAEALLEHFETAVDYLKRLVANRKNKARP